MYSPLVSIDVNDKVRPDSRKKNYGWTFAFQYPTCDYRTSAQFFQHIWAWQPCQLVVFQAGSLKRPTR